jgi:hypothetical protein
LAEELAGPGWGRMMSYVTARKMPSGVVFSTTTEDEAKCVYAHR